MKSASVGEGCFYHEAPYEVKAAGIHLERRIVEIFGCVVGKDGVGCVWFMNAGDKDWKARSAVIYMDTTNYTYIHILFLLFSFPSFPVLSSSLLYFLPFKPHNPTSLVQKIKSPKP
ncbi:hypothetical protein BDZ45DRAFT_187956 [Acephala macrosclerotiorum]|nr:hypothetical protein BDZ45DRAFT_187956 [Acephala macrosclerotiorum]